MVTWRLGRWLGLAWEARPTVIAGSAAVWAGLALLAAGVLKMPFATAAAFGAGGMVLHWLSEAWHQCGHAWAARRTGHPMTGVRFWGVLATSLYPNDEGTLPAAVHVRRALGGPLASAVLTVVAGLLGLALSETRGLPWWLAAFACAENLVVFTLQALVPLGFNDGATLWHWLPRRKQ